MNNIIITIKKELRSIVRDKKTFITLLAMPLIGMFFVIVYGVMFDQNQVLEPYKVGIDYEPNIIENIVSSEYQLETVKYDNLGEMEKSYKDKDINAYIDYNKEEIVKKEIDLEYITKYQNNPELPSGMIQVVQEGIDGKQEEITKKIYEGDKLTEEKIVGNTVTKASVNKIVEVGTGRHIINYNAEIGDDIYITPSLAV